MIVWLNNSEKDFLLSQCEKAEIEKLYQKGGRHLFFSRINSDCIEVYNEDIEGKPKELVAILHGSVVHVLRCLCDGKCEGFVKLSCIMNKYFNVCSIHLTEQEKEQLRGIYNSGGRYLLLGIKYLNVHDEYQIAMYSVSGAAVNAMIRINDIAGKRYLADGLFFDLALIIEELCN